MSVIGNLRYFGKIGVSADGFFSSLVAYKSSSFEFENLDCYLWHLHKDSVSSRPRNIERILDESEVFMNFFNMLESLHNESKIPKPIFAFYHGYRKNIDILKKSHKTEKIMPYVEDLQKIKKWLIHGKYVTVKSFLGILFPKLYDAFRKIHLSEILKN